MVDQKKIRSEADRFLLNFRENSEVSAKVEELVEFNEKTLDTMLDNIRTDALLDDGIANAIIAKTNIALSIANDYYKVLGITPKEGSKLINLDSKANHLLSSSERYKKAKIDGFDTAYSMFENAQTNLVHAESISKTRKARTYTDDLFEKCLNLLNKMGEERTAIKGNEITNINKYERLRDNVKSIELDIDQLYSDYKSLDLTKDSKGLKDLRKKIKSKGFSKGALVKQSRDLGFIEGLERLKELEDEAAYFVEHFDHVAKTRKSLDKYMNETANNLEFIANLDQGKLSIDNLGQISKISTISLGKFRDYENTIILGDLVQEYKERIQSLAADASDILIAEKTRLNSRYDEITLEASLIPVKISGINDYLQKADAWNSELKHIEQRNAAINNSKTEASTLLQANTGITRNLKRIKSEYDSLAANENEAKVLQQQMEFEINPTRIDDLAGLISKSKEITVPSGDLREEFQDAYSALNNRLKLLSQTAVNHITNIRDSNGQTKNQLEYALSLYEKFSGSVDDVSTRIAETKTMIQSIEEDSKHAAEVEGYRTRLNDKDSELQLTQQEIDTLRSELSGVRKGGEKQISQLTSRLQQLESELKEKEKIHYWNNKYSLADGQVKYKVKPTDNVVLPVRDQKLWDVRDFIQGDNPRLEEIVKEAQLKGETHDETAYNCMMFVQENLKYVPDDITADSPEEWYFPSEMVQRKIIVGDCEDGANLMASLMRNAEIPAYRVKVAAGLVATAPGAPDGGHAWPIYLRETDDKWVNLDWCYKPDPDTPVAERKLAKEMSEDYKEIWFTYNDEHSWAGEALEIDKGYLHKEPKQEQENIPVNTRHFGKKEIRSQKDNIPVNTKHFGNKDKVSTASIDNTVEEDTVHYESDDEYIPIGDISPFFSLPLYIESIGHPQNFRYFTMRNILAGNHGEPTWEARFDNFCKEVKVMSSPQEMADMEYLQKMAFGIQKTLTSPPPKFNERGARRAYESLIKAIDAAV